tara:strand:+ start:851 stop:1087 length:237 start_codon:yes stop_codon:yes gene_type:complete
MELKEWVIGALVILVIIVVFSYVGENVERAPLGDVHDPITQESPARWRIPSPLATPPDDGDETPYSSEETDSGEEQQE